MPIVVLYFPPEGYLQSICLLILFIYPSKVMSNCVSFHLCVLNWLSQYTSLFSAFYKHSYQWIASACRNFHGSKFCLGNTPGSPLLSKNVVKTTRHHHIQCLQILLYTGGSAVCTSGHRLRFLYGTQMLPVSACKYFLYLSDRLEFKGWYQEVNNKILLFYNPLSIYLCCFSAKDFDSPMGASIS